MPSLIGNKPNQVPTNGDLGTMAFREADQFFDVRQTVGFRNRIINGDMRIDQRNAGASVTPANGQYTTDRWAISHTQASKLTVQQNAGAVTPPVGFTNYLGITSSSSYSVVSGDTFLLTQRIEGLNVADLAWGTAAARAVTFSFWVRSSLTGSFGGALSNSASDRAYTFSYPITAANTWEYKTVTIPGDTSGTWLKDNLIGLSVRFGLGSGDTFTAAAGSWGAGNRVQPPSTVSVVGTSGATLYVTGVQLEVGSGATPFESRPYGTELALCQRYYQIIHNSQTAVLSGRAGSTSVIRFAAPLSVALRASPSVTDMGATVAYSSAAPVTSSGGSTSVYSYVQNATVILFAHNGFTISDDRLYGIGNNTNSLIVSAEL